MSNLFGFSTETAAGGGDFMPVCKYDARSGRLFRIDRVNTGNGFQSEPVDITSIFKAVVDFENMQVGWIDFPVGSAPSFVLVPFADFTAGKIALPQKPSEKHKNGLRFTLKLGKACGGDKPLREMAGTAKAFLSGVEEVCQEYIKTKAQYAGQLPVLELVSTMPVKSGSGQASSTNYRPKFRISGWAPRPADLVAKPVPIAGAPVEHLPAPTAAPSTGATVVPPNVMQGVPAPAVQMADDDFG